MALADSFTALASNLLQKFGESATLVRHSARVDSGPEWAPVAGEAPTETVLAARWDEAGRNRDGLVGVTVSKVLITSTAEPKRDDVLRFAGVDLRIIEARPIRLTGQAVAYEMDVEA